MIAGVSLSLDGFASVSAAADIGSLRGQFVFHLIGVRSTSPPPDPACTDFEKTSSDDSMRSTASRRIYPIASSEGTRPELRFRRVVAKYACLFGMAWGWSTAPQPNHNCTENQDAGTDECELSVSYRSFARFDNSTSSSISHCLRQEVEVRKHLQSDEAIG